MMVKCMPIFFLTFSMQDSSGIIASFSNLTMKVEKQSMLRSYEIIRVLTLKYIYIYIYILEQDSSFMHGENKRFNFYLFTYFYSCRVTHITN